MLDVKIDQISYSDCIDKLRFVNPVFYLLESPELLDTANSDDTNDSSEFNRSFLHHASEAGERDEVKHFKIYSWQK